MALAKLQELPLDARRRVANALTAILVILIAVLTLYPIAIPRTIAPGPDKIYHLVAFASLVMPASVLYPRALMWLIPFAAVFGAAIELVQPFVNRSGEMADFWANVWGIGAGVLIGTVIHRFSISTARRSAE